MVRARRLASRQPGLSIFQPASWPDCAGRLARTEDAAHLGADLAGQSAVGTLDATRAVWRPRTSARCDVSDGLAGARICAAAARAGRVVGGGRGVLHPVVRIAAEPAVSLSDRPVTGSRGRLGMDR